MTKFSFKLRPDVIRRLESETFDVLVVGGGINGAGVCRDLVLRDYAEKRPRLALIEKGHYASSASSKNSQLIHGGLRYLKYLDYKLVAEALREREILLKIAPHAVWRQSFLIPIYSHFDRWYYRLGLFFYDRLAGESSLGNSRWLDAQRALEAEPGLNPDGLRGALQYYDGRMNPARLVLDQLRECSEKGAAVANFVEAKQPFGEGGRIRGVIARDAISGKEFPIRARSVIYAVGPWEQTLQLRLVRGSHLIFPNLLKGQHAIAYFEKSGRIVFVIPFGPGGRYALVGTTEQEQPAPEPTSVSPEEERYLKGLLELILPESRSFSMSGKYAALRPLIPDGSRSATSVSRTHRIWKSSENVYHIGGGKWTTFRIMAEELADRVAFEQLPGAGNSKTAQTPIDGNRADEIESLRERSGELAQQNRLPKETIELFLDYYGVRAPELISLCKDPRLAKPVVASTSELSTFVKAQISWAVENEMTDRIVDFLTASTPLYYLHPFNSRELDELRTEFNLE